MFTLEDIRALILTAGEARIAELEVEKDGWRIRIGGRSAQPPAASSEAPPAPAPATPAPATPAKDRVILAPGHGVFHRSASPDDPPYAEIGQDIAKGQQVGIVEAMKVFSAILSPMSGRVAEILVDNGQDVEAGQPLLRLQ